MKILVDSELLECALGDNPMDAWDARKELRALLAQPAQQQEPVAWLCAHFDGRTRVEVKGGVYDQDAGWGASRTPLFTHPAPADTRLVEALESCVGWMKWMNDPRCGYGDTLELLINNADAALAAARVKP